MSPFIFYFLFPNVYLNVFTLIIAIDGGRDHGQENAAVAVYLKERQGKSEADYTGSSSVSVEESSAAHERHVSQR